MSELHNSWDQERMIRPATCGLIERAAEIVLWGGNYFDLPTSRGWLRKWLSRRGFTEGFVGPLRHQPWYESESDRSRCDADRPIRPGRTHDQVAHGQR